MPGLARKILIFAAVDGLVLQPLAQRGQRPVSAASIAYSDNSIVPILKDGGEAERAGKSFEAFGIVGILTVSKSSFLISITKRQQVAQIQGKPIYMITEVALTPLSSKTEAELSIAQTQAGLQKKVGDEHGLDDSDTDDDEGEVSAAVSDDVDDDDLHPPAEELLRTGQSLGEHKRTSSVAEDVISRKGGYGRFAQKWFSRKGWTVDQRRNLGMSVSGPDSTISKPINESHDRSNREPTSIVAGLESEKKLRNKSTEQLPSIVNGLEKEKRLKGNPTKNISSITNSFGTQGTLSNDQDVAQNLLPKLLRTTQILFGASRSFFFSYDYDITRSFATRRTTNSELPLYKEVDPLFFWNQHVIQSFIDAGQSSLVLPLMQGFVGQRSFMMDTDPPKPTLGLDGVEKSSMEMTDFTVGGKDQSTSSAEESDSRQILRTEKSFLLTLISRRSVKRAGLRYLRRGVDEEGHTANGVETEQILSEASWAPSSKIHSFVQIRGSIPIFFSQSPYSFKPVPQIQHSAETNFRAFKNHFDNLSDRYGSIQVASLVEKHGPEAIVGDVYEKNMDRLNNVSGTNGNSIGFEWFDFHAMCRGMKFENVSLLMDALGSKLDNFGDTVEAESQQLSRQKGVLRTNCMDCLDRTNVVQSACGRRALELQLKTEGIDLTLQTDQTTQWFNTLWADNGDAISKQYASTAALKGDFTRTRKRDYKGALTDMGLSISRFYSGQEIRKLLVSPCANSSSIVNDYFSQAAIDFLLGTVSSLVFEDFEANLMSVDPAVSMQKMRQQAIDVSQKLVVADEHEELIGGWTLLTPQVPNTIKSMPFEEAVLLLTDAALYATRFDWNIEKVISFERVELSHIISLKYGTYITSTLSVAQADEKKNVGFIVTYKAGMNDVTRVNTRSMSTARSQDQGDPLGGTPTAPPATGLASFLARQQPPPANRVLAWKALPSRSAVAEGHDRPVLSEMENIKAICSEIERIVLLGKVVEVGSEIRGVVERGDIITLSEARKNTGLLEQLGHSLKKLVWA